MNRLASFASPAAPIAIAAALVGTVSLAIGAHAALNMRALDAAKAVATEQSADAAKPASRASRW